LGIHSVIISCATHKTSCNLQKLVVVGPKPYPGIHEDIGLCHNPVF